MTEKMAAFLAAGESEVGEPTMARPAIADSEEVKRSCVGGNANFMRTALTLELPAETTDEDVDGEGMFDDEAEEDLEDVKDKADEGDEEEEEEEEEEKGGKGKEEDDENENKAGKVVEEKD